MSSLARTSRTSLHLMIAVALAVSGRAAPSGEGGEAASIREAGSFREAAAAIQELSRAGAAGLATLTSLIDDEGLHPEVRYHVIRAALASPEPGAVSLARRFLADPDRDLRQLAAARLRDAPDRARDELFAAIAAETDPELLALELNLLGASGDPRAKRTLLAHLDHPQGGRLLAGIAYGLAALGARDAVPAVAARLGEDTPLADVRHVMTGLDRMLGGTDLAARLAHARTPGGPLRAFGLYMLADPAAARPAGAAPSIRDAAAGALADPRPFVRLQAVRALAAAGRTPFGYISDPAIVRRLAAAAGDAAAPVRLEVLESLHGTLLRRALAVPGDRVVALHPETMRLLRWPCDWIAFPAAVTLLDDPVPAIRGRAAWMLGIATGAWHGYDDIRLEGPARVTDEVRAAYRALWLEMRPHEPAEWTAILLDGAVASLAAEPDPERLAARVRGIELATGARLELPAEPADPEARGAAVQAIAAWWRGARDRPPAERLATALRSGPDRRRALEALHVLGRWVAEPVPAELATLDSAAEPERFQEAFETWLNGVAPPRSSSSPSSR